MDQTIVDPPSLEHCFGTITPLLQAFLETHQVALASTDTHKVQRILDGLFSENASGNAFQYDAQATYTPTEALVHMRGNCLTFAGLLVTLAREVGVDARFNDVDIAPSWDLRGDFPIETSHINVFIQTRNQRFVVEWIDFYRGYAPYYFNPIADPKAIAYFYNNLAINALSENQWARAATLLDQALVADPDNAIAWQTYAAYWRHQENMEQMVSALHRAAKSKRGSTSVFVALQDYYEHIGLLDRARSYAKLARKYADKNPFYLQKRAKTAVQEEDFTEAIRLLKRAIRILPNYEPFQYDLASSYQNKYRGQGWETCLEKAKQFSYLAVNRREP